MKLFVRKLIPEDCCHIVDGELVIDDKIMSIAEDMLNRELAISIFEYTKDKEYTVVSGVNKDYESLVNYNNFMVQVTYSVEVELTRNLNVVTSKFIFAEPITNCRRFNGG